MSASVVAVTSGTGGVGKTFVSVSLANALAQRGERVLVLDAELGLVNLDAVLDLQPRATLRDVFSGRAELDDAVTPAPGGFSVLCAGAGLVEHSRFATGLGTKLFEAVASIVPRYDRVLIDTGAGVSDVVLHAVSLAGEVLVVATPEPAAMTDAYATIKALGSRQQRRTVLLLVNRAGRPGEAVRIHDRLQLVVDRFVNPGLATPLSVRLLGEIANDDAVRGAVARRRPLLEVCPGAPAALAVDALAERLVSQQDAGGQALAAGDAIVPGR